MGEEEQYQIKKDTLWEIHLLDKKIACLDRKLTTFMESISEIHGTWKAGNLGVNVNHLVRRTGADRAAEHLNGLPDSSEFTKTVEDLETTRHKRDDLQQSFDRM